MRAVLTSPAFISLSVQNFLFFCSMNVMNILPDFLVGLGATKSYVGLFMNINSLALVLLVLPLSRWTDSIGRGRLLFWGHSLYLIALSLSFFFHQDPYLLGIFRALGTLSFCAAFTIFGAEIYGIIPADRRVAGVAIFGISGLLSNPVSSLTGEFLLHNFGAAGVFAGAFGFLVPVWFLTLKHSWHKPGIQKAGGRKFLTILREPRMVPLLALTLVFGGAFSVFSSFLANHSAARLGSVLISPFFTAFALVAILSRVFLSGFLDRMSKRLLVGGCFFLLTGAFTLMVLLQEPWMLALAGGLYGLGHSILFPVFSTLFVHSGQDEERLTLNNMFASVNTLGNFVFAIGLGFVGDALGTPWIFGLMGIFAVVAGLAALGLLGKQGAFRELKPRAEPTKI